MKSNYMRIGGAEHRQKMREICKEEIKRQKKEFCPECEEMIQSQVVATLCKVLHDRFGFGQKRLLELLQLAESLDKYAVGFGCTDSIWVDWLKEHMGIVLIPPKPEKQEV